VKRNPVNEQIKAREVLLIDENGQKLGVMSREKALEIAASKNLDLVQVSPQEVPVCRIMDYDKYLYAKEKKQRAGKHHTSTLKEVRFRPHTDEHDIEIKLSKVKKFLEEGHKVRITIFFKGREAIFVQEGYKLMERIEKILSDVAKLENKPQLFGRRLIAVFTKKK